MTEVPLQNTGGQAQGFQRQGGVAAGARAHRFPPHALCVHENAQQEARLRRGHTVRFQRLYYTCRGCATLCGGISISAGCIT